VARLQHPSRWTGRIIPLPRGERLDLIGRVSRHPHLDSWGLGRFVFALRVSGFRAAGPGSVPAKRQIYPSRVRPRGVTEPIEMEIRPAGQPEGPPGCCQGVSPQWLSDGQTDDVRCSRRVRDIFQVTMNLGRNDLTVDFGKWTRPRSGIG